MDAIVATSTTPDELPIAQARDDIVRLLVKHDFLVVVGDTGSGKTTQVPAYLLAADEARLAAEAAAPATPRRSAPTTPSRPSRSRSRGRARDVRSQRVAEERGCDLGGSDVGYKVRFDSNVGAATGSRLTFMTDGVLVRDKQTQVMTRFGPASRSYVGAASTPRCSSIVAAAGHARLREQRAGRAGRTTSGQCYRLYSKQCFANMAPETIPEIRRSSMCSVALALKSLHVDDVLDFDFLDAPDETQLACALLELHALGALDAANKGRLTDAKKARDQLDDELRRVAPEAPSGGGRVDLAETCDALCAGLCLNAAERTLNDAYLLLPCAGTAYEAREAARGGKPAAPHVALVRLDATTTSAFARPRTRSASSSCAPPATRGSFAKNAAVVDRATLTCRTRVDTTTPEALCGRPPKPVEAAPAKPRRRAAGRRRPREKAAPPAASALAAAKARFLARKR
ncbi:ATP-dependent RNA helicase [Aureococcus anophagefferens]|nr:ATP-dependent RNA helicase [Aureococcus anophagefferens]